MRIEAIIFMVFIFLVCFGGFVYTLCLYSKRE
ncbi:MAG: MetS family NSS transporter small subunit [Candidatus Aminicenantia bacterium]